MKSVWLEWLQQQLGLITIFQALFWMYTSKDTMCGSYIAKYTVVHDSYSLGDQGVLIKLHMMDMWHVFIILIHMSCWCLSLLQW